MSFYNSIYEKTLKQKGGDRTTWSILSVVALFFLFIITVVIIAVIKSSDKQDPTTTTPATTSPATTSPPTTTTPATTSPATTSPATTSPPTTSPPTTSPPAPSVTTPPPPAPSVTTPPATAYKTVTINYSSFSSRMQFNIIYDDRSFSRTDLLEKGGNIINKVSDYIRIPLIKNILGVVLDYESEFPCRCEVYNIPNDLFNDGSILDITESPFSIMSKVNITIDGIDCSEYYNSDVSCNSDINKCMAPGMVLLSKDW